jgi:putative addiction module component (TIGR02574 family)
MGYNKNELLKLPVKEKQELAEALWNSIEDNLMPVTKEEVAFAKERYQMHLDKPEEGLTIEELKKKVKSKYGF